MDGGRFEVGYGKLIVKAYMARDALPVEGALVRVVGIDEGVSDDYHSRFTDADGITEEIELYAPPRSYSTSHGSVEQPYSQYEVTVTKSGYYPKRVTGVAVFEGITTFLPVNMVLGDSGDSPPLDTLLSESYENENLE